MIRNSIAAVSFTRDIIENSRGQTARAFNIGNLFGSSNSTLNLKLTDPHAGRFSLKVTDGASSWLQNNMGITIDNLQHE
jgi:hypothetical protein